MGLEWICVLSGALARLDACFLSDGHPLAGEDHSREELNLS